MRLTIAILTMALCFAGTAPVSSAADKTADRGTDNVAGRYDVVVYGGTSAAVIAAVQTVRMGKTAAIVSPDEHLGGLSSGGLGATDSGNRTVIGGLSREFYHRLWTCYQNPKFWKWQEMPMENGIPGQGGRGIDNDTKTMWVFEPHVAELVFDGFVKEYRIPVFRNEWLDREKGVTKDGSKIVAMTTLSGKTFRGRVFIDATYEGDLMAAAGVTYVTGREPNAKYNETLNGIQRGQARHHQFPGFVDPYIVPGDPKSGLLPCVNAEIKGNDGDGDTKIQAYNLRLCLTNVPENRVPFAKPEGYDPLRYELLLRSIEAGQKYFFTTSPMPNHKTDSNNTLAFSTDYIGGNYEYPDAGYEKRREIYREHVRWCQGLMWTLVSNKRVPRSIRESVAQWGLSKDEFAETGYYPHQMYVREARRMVSDFVITERHLRRLDPTPRSVGMGSYQMDSHHTQRYVDREMYGKPSVRNEGDVEVNPGGPYPIDYLALVPKKGECGNLGVPCCVSSSHIAFGSIRMEPVFMLLGQSVATAAVMAIDGNIDLQDVDYKTLAKRLEEDKQVLDVEYTRRNVPKDKLKGIVLDSDAAEIVGEWQHAQGIGFYVDIDYIHDKNEGKGQKSVTFRVPVPKQGEYECRLAYSWHGNRATNVPVTVASGSKSKIVVVNERKEPSIDKLFVSLGTINADKEIVITIGTEGTNGHVIADAVQVLPAQ